MEELNRVTGRSEHMAYLTSNDKSLGRAKPARRSLLQRLGERLSKAPSQKDCPVPSPKNSFLFLPLEIHFTIASFLPPSAHLILAATPNHHLQHLYPLPAALKHDRYRHDVPSRELALARELYTRDTWQIHGKSIIKAKLLYPWRKLSPKQKDVVDKTVFFCHGCQVQASYGHFPVADLFAELHAHPKRKVVDRKCWGEVKPLRIFEGEKLTWEQLKTWKDRCETMGEVEWEKEKSAWQEVARLEAERAVSAGITSAANPNGHAVGTANITTTTMPTLPPASPTTIRIRPLLYHAPSFGFRPDRLLNMTMTPHPFMPHTPYTPPDISCSATCYWTLLCPMFLPEFPPPSYMTTPSLLPALVFKRPHFCPHLSWTSCLGANTSTNTNSPTKGTPLITHLTSSINAADLLWEDRVVAQGGRVLHKVKSVGVDCANSECRTHVMLERARDRVTGTRWGGRADRFWVETVWIKVERSWRVKCPGDGEWMAQIGL